MKYEIPSLNHNIFTPITHAGCSNGSNASDTDDQAITCRTGSSAAHSTPGEETACYGGNGANHSRSCCYGYENTNDFYTACNTGGNAIDTKYDSGTCLDGSGVGG